MTHTTNVHIMRSSRTHSKSRSQHGGAALAALAILFALLTPTSAAAMPYRCNSVEPIVNPIKPASIPTVDDGGQFHTDCGGAGMAGFTFSRSGSTYFRMDLITGNNTYRVGTGKATGWALNKDTAGHGGKAWKLKDRTGSIRASIYADGKFAYDRYSQCAA
ncbi:hypothetical protein [Micrococcus endophyticus]|uniref:hypothetical protein n=1 Tax=Micrococcus endophyticus TaxID=455343 RepID=UPI00130DD61A|nr:hypothetical protein [Micrococcus endophyticus]MCK6091168.1 hypothetical protein [Micrococcus endophyticus]